MYPFVPGCSTQKYFPYDEEENAAQYKKVQKQRELERKVRASKRECMMLKDGDPEAFQKASVKLKHNTQQLKTYCSSNDLTYMNERTTVMGYGRSEAGKVTAAYNRALKQEQEKLNKVVDISGGSGIIKEKHSEATISNIDSPIEQRHTGKGNPNAILMFEDIPLNNRQQRLLESLPEYDSRKVVLRKSVNMADLSALTAKTGDEFAMFTKGGERLIIRGNYSMVNIDVKEAQKLAAQGYKWSGHTHPGTGINTTLPSTGDMEILQCFKQKMSVIYDSKGGFRTFEKE